MAANVGMYAGRPVREPGVRASSQENSFAHQKEILQSKIHQALEQFTKQALENNKLYTRFAQNEFKAIKQGRHVTQTLVTDAASKKEASRAKETERYEQAKKLIQQLRELEQAHSERVKVEELDESTVQQETRQVGLVINDLIASLQETNKGYAEHAAYQFTVIPEKKHVEQCDVEDNTYLLLMTQGIAQSHLETIQRLLELQGMEATPACMPQKIIEEAIDAYISTLHKANKLFVDYALSLSQCLKGNYKVTQNDVDDSKYLFAIKQNVIGCYYETIQWCVKIHGKGPLSIKNLTEQIDAVQKFMKSSIEAYQRSSSAAADISVDFVKSQFKAAKAGHAVTEMDKDKAQFIQHLGELLLKIGTQSQELTQLHKQWE